MGTPERPDRRERVSRAAIHLDGWLRERIRGVRDRSSPVVKAVGVASAALLALKNTDLPEASDWKGATTWQVVLAFTLVFTAVSGWILISSLVRNARWHERRADLLNACHDLNRIASRELGTDRVGSHVWKIRGAPGAKYLDLYVRVPSTGAEEFKQMYRYHAVVVLPVRSPASHHHRLVGFVTVETLAAGYGAKLGALQTSGAFDEVVSLCVEALGTS
jgi:hypothetical protein